MLVQCYLVNVLKGPSKYCKVNPKNEKIQICAEDMTEISWR